MVDVRRQGDRIILVKLGFGDMVLNVISAYAPQLDDSFDDTNTRFVRRIQESDIKETLKRMEGGKAMGPDCITIEVWRCPRDIAIVWLTDKDIATMDTTKTIAISSIFDQEMMSMQRNMIRCDDAGSTVSLTTKV